MSNLTKNQLNHSQVSSHYSKKHNNQQDHSRINAIELQHQIRSLQDQIQFTICNYEGVLATQKKNTAERNEFLLYLIQTMKQKHNQQLQILRNQLDAAIRQKQHANAMENQIANIGEGVDSIVEKGKQLKKTNQSLKIQLQQQNSRERQLDQQIESEYQKIQALKQELHQFQLNKLKWNRKKNDLLGMIQQAEKKIKNHQKLCQTTGIQEQNCQHCSQLNMKKLMNKYQGNSK